MTKTSKMTHDQIVLSLSESRIKQIITPYLGEKGFWANNVWHVLAGGGSSVFRYLTEDIASSIADYADKRELHGLTELISSLRNDRASIEKLGVQEAINIEYAFEHPLIKGTGQYAITKGYLDLVVLAKPVSIGPFTAYSHNTKQFVIEVKTSKEMKDMGSVLRQIKEYREYYGYSTKIFETESMTIGWNELREIVWVLVTPSVTDEVKSFFVANGIQVHSLESEQNTLSEPEDDGSVSGVIETEKKDAQ